MLPWMWKASSTNAPAATIDTRSHIGPCPDETLLTAVPFKHRFSGATRVESGAHTTVLTTCSTSRILLLIILARVRHARICNVLE